MPLDLPPLPAAPPVLAAIVQQAAVTATLAGQQSLEVVGATGLAEARIQAAIAGAANAEEAAARLRQAYADAGFALVSVRVEQAGDAARLVVTQGRFAEVSGPERFRPYFAGVLKKPQPRSSDVITAVTRAEAVASRSGQHLDVRDAPTETGGEYRLVVKPEPVAGWHPVGVTLSAGNYGNRYAGRDIGNAALRLNPGGGTQVDVTAAKHIDHLSQNNEGADYQSGGLTVSVATRWGTYGIQGQVTDYQTGFDQRDQLPPGTDGDIRQFGVWGQQLVHAGRNHAWSVNESVHHASNRSDVTDDIRLYDQEYTYLRLGTDFQLNPSQASRSKFNSALWVAQGLTGDFDGIRVRTPSAPPVACSEPVVIGGGSEFNIDDQIFVGGGTGNIIIDPELEEPCAAVDPGAASGGVVRTPKQHFRLVGVELSYAYPLPSHVELAASLSGQYTGNTMPNLQQFVLGGFGKLTGYLPGVAVGDRGGLLRLGVTRSEIHLGGLNLTLGSYLEGGATEYANPLPGAGAWQSLVDAGIAITGETSFGTRGVLAYAEPISSRNVSSELREDARADLYFQLQQRF